MEIWKSVKNYENLYEVSSMGKVREIKTKKILNQRKNNGSQLVLCLSNNYHNGIYSVRNIVAEAFLNYNKKSNKVVDHIDWNTFNNSVENLQVISKIEYYKKQRYNEQRKDGVMHVKQINKWMSTFTYENESIYLGLFDTEKQALEAIEFIFKKKHVLIKKGVYFHPFSNKYRAIQSINGNSQLLGSFDTAIEAYKFYLMNKNF